MSFDLRAPKPLKDCQEWFASIIVRPIDMDNKIASLAPTGVPIEEEASKFIAPSSTLQSHQRIELYNQQYWWRLLSVLQEIFPLVVRLFGYSDFNQYIGFKYLVKYPPTHWNLNTIGDNLCKWLEEEYIDGDKQLVKDSAAIDWGYNQSFVAEELEQLNITNDNDLATISEATLYLQPSVHLFQFNYNLFHFRDQMLEQSPEYWIDNDFPTMDKGEKQFILCRSPSLQVIWSEISQGEYYLLKRFQQGSSVAEACEWLETHKPDLMNDAAKGIQAWFQQWIARGWLSLKPSIQQKKPATPDASTLFAIMRAKRNNIHSE